MNPLWLEREAALRKMLQDGMSDEAIGERWNMRPRSVMNMRCALGIKCTESERVAVPSPRPVCTYEENGSTVTRYPSAIAVGADVNPYTAKPRGRK